jgi:hypothetical protein
MNSQPSAFFCLVTIVASEEEYSVRLSIFIVFTGKALHFGSVVELLPCADDRHASAASPPVEKPQVPLNKGAVGDGPQCSSGRSGV